MRLTHSNHARAAGESSPRRPRAILAGKILAVLSAPFLIYAFGGNPPLAHTGAPGEGTCSSCHGNLTAGSGVTVNAPASYTPGGAPVSMTVTIPSIGGFELTILTQSGGTAAGAFTAGAQNGTSTVGSKQYVYSTVETTSWTFNWMPPATDAGAVVLYVAGGAHNTNYSNSYVIPSAGGPPPALTLSAMPSSLSFTVNGTTPPTQTVQVTSSGAPLAFTTTTATTSGGTWLTATPPGANTPMGVTVGIAAAGLATGTYTGSLSIAAASATNSPLSIPVTVNVTTPVRPSVPTLNLGAPSLTFNASPGGSATPQNVSVTASDGSMITFNAAATATSGGSWLSVSPGTGTTPGSEAVAVNLSGLAAGTYQGAVTFTSSAVSNSPLSLPVTLVVAPPPPPPSGTPQFDVVTVDRQTGGSDWLLLDGTGSADSSGQVKGGGSFTRFRSTFGGDDGSGSAPASAIVSNGTWTPTSFTSFTPVSGSDTGGTLVMEVRLSPQGASPRDATMTINSTGQNSGVTLQIHGGASFEPAGIGHVSLTGTGGSSGGSGGGGTRSVDDAASRR